MIDRGIEQWNVPEGTEVFGAEGDKIGKIVAAHPTYIVVEKGFFFPNDYYIPAQAIAHFDGERIHLTMTKEEALAQDWTTAPTGDYATSAGLTSETTTAGAPNFGTNMGASAADLPAAATAGRDNSVYDRDIGTERQTVDDDVVRVPVREEELTATKRARDLGEVTIETDVVAEDRVLDVPVTEERVRVQRRAVDREATPDDTTFEGGTIKVALRGEEVELEKRTRVIEEVEIAKEQVQRTEQVGGTVRREQVRVRDNATGITDAEAAAREAELDEGTRPS